MFAFFCSERRPIGRNADARYIEDSSEQGLVNLGKINSQTLLGPPTNCYRTFTTGALSKHPINRQSFTSEKSGTIPQTYFDTDLLLQGMKRDLLASNRVESLRRRQQTTDQYAKDVREKLGRGTLCGFSSPPVFSLSGRS